MEQVRKTQVGAEENCVAAAEDERLLADIRAGRPGACAELIHEHYQGVYRFLVHLTRDVQLAEDLTQDTFVTVWEKIGSFAGRSSVATWLNRIAFGKFVDGRRRARRGLEVHNTVCQRASSTTWTTPLDEVIADDQTRRLYAVLHLLEPRDQALLVLHYLQGLSYRDMADVFGEPANTLKWRIRAALAQLRTLFSREANRHEQKSVE
jgi:RNA polymerase sigma-70 factor (ECF subfamily)